MGALRRGTRRWDIDGERSLRVFIFNAGFSVILLIVLGEYGRGRWRGRTISRQPLGQWRNGGDNVVKGRVLTGSCTLLIAGRFTCRMYVGAVPFRLPPGEPHGSGGNRSYTGASRKRHGIPGTGCGACMAGGRSRGSLCVVTEAGGRLPYHPLGGSRPVGIIACHSGHVKFATFRRMIPSSIAAA